MPWTSQGWICVCSKDTNPAPLPEDLDCILIAIRFSAETPGQLTQYDRFNNMNNGSAEAKPVCSAVGRSQCK